MKFFLLGEIAGNFKGFHSTDEIGFIFDNLVIAIDRDKEITKIKSFIFNIPPDDTLNIIFDEKILAKYIHLIEEFHQYLDKNTILLDPYLFSTPIQ